MRMAPKNRLFLSAGASSLVFKESETTIIKVPRDPDQSRRALSVECDIYNRLGSHPYVTKAFSTTSNCLVLEHLQYPLRHRLDRLRKDGQLPPPQDVIRWASQIAQALQHVHAHNVLQVDIGPHNVLLDWDENVKLSDFAGSSIDGCEPLVAPSEHSRHPELLAATPSIQSEIFALGSTLYEVETTRQPYRNKEEKDIQKLFRAQSFPDTSALVLGDVITKCWHLEYHSVDEAVRDLESIQKKLDAMGYLP